MFDRYVPALLTNTSTAPYSFSIASITLLIYNTALRFVEIRLQFADLPAALETHHTAVLSVFVHYLVLINYAQHF